MRALLVGLGGQEAVARVGADDRAAELHVGDQAVNVDRHPGRIGDGVPQLDRSRVGGGGDVPWRGHHVGEPRVRDEHHDRAPHVEQDAERPVAPFGPARLPAVPPVVIEVEGERLDEEQADVQPHRGPEHRGEVGEESGVEGRQEEGQHRPPDRGRAVGHEQETRELLAQAVVALVLAEDADRFGDDGEQRHAEHERREHQVYLGGDPDCRPCPDDREFAVGARRVGGGLKKQRRHPLSVIRCPLRKTACVWRNRWAWRSGPPRAAPA